MEQVGETISDRMVYYANPGGKLKVFKFNGEKLEYLVNKFIHTYLWAPDEVRSRDGALTFLMALFPYFFSDNPPYNSIVYEIGDMEGILGFVNIIPRYKCEFIVRLWDKDGWGPDLSRQIKDIVNKFANEWEMRRMSFSSPDFRFKKFAKMIGFKLEGTQKYGFRHNGKLYTNNLYRWTKED